MKLLISHPEEVATLVRMSKAAFDSDVEVGAPGAGGPPEYDNEAWHNDMLRDGHLYSAYEDGMLVGGALLFIDDKEPNMMYVGRIFIDPSQHRKGFGMKLMQCIESACPGVNTFVLDTPLWNTRTNNFYKKLGYTELKRDKYFAFYQKKLCE